MTTKDSFIAGNLACQNIGDCSLFELPILYNEPKEKKAKHNKVVDQNKKTVKKISAVVALSVVIGLIIAI